MLFEKCETTYSKTKTSFENESFSPDGSGILFVFSLKTKRYSGQQEELLKKWMFL